MNPKIFLPAFIFIFLQFCCTDHTLKKVASQQNDSTQQHSFFPVTEYIKGQLSELDSMPVTPLKIITLNGKADSVWMKKEDIRPFAQPFLHPQIDTANFKNLFTERSFLDQTINAITLSYDPIDKLPDSLQLRRWDVYIDPVKNTIKRIYIEKELKQNGIIQTIQLTWKSNQWCKITTITGQSSNVKEETMKWDFKNDF